MNKSNTYDRCPHCQETIPGTRFVRCDLCSTEIDLMTADRGSPVEIALSGGPGINSLKVVRRYAFLCAECYSKIVERLQALGTKELMEDLLQ